MLSDLDNSGNELLHPSPAATGPLRLVLVTHDESTFYQNDQRQIHWGCPGSETPKAKGEGVKTLQGPEMLDVSVKL